MRLETKRLIIRSLLPEDEAAYIEMAADGSLHEIFGDCSDCKEWMGDWLKEAIQLDKENNPRREYLAYAIAEKENGQVIGSVGCSYYADLDKTGITYFIGNDYRQKGYAAEAARAYADYFLKNYPYPEIIATIQTKNIPSCKVAEQAGFSLTETKNYRDINDEKEEIYNFYKKTI
ncbi:MAG: GNAT family N-acetyltransferase [Lachnospiraceae bacterium]|nr:GNAT family N-acetyltransferase [Lachnospiraceae bacterium]